MSEIKYVDIVEWQKMGGLQEANRLFFHPHGWALEITRIDETGWGQRNKSGQMSKWVLRMAKALETCGLANGGPEATRAAVELLMALYPSGTAFLSGIWDCSDDPEGVVFGHWDESWIARAKAVHEKRLEHFAARAALFYGKEGPKWALQEPGEEEERDIEPFDYVWKDPEK